MEIVKLNGTLAFQVRGGYIKPTGYALKMADGSFVGFAQDAGPYIPIGGRKALQAIVDAGGFTSFDGMVRWSAR
ncbi:3-isopropylmalate dehydratase [Cohnella zeiphila]|uniref:3-isopropylmalate dehydratase n=1 Tax=Cohnella zeiphila TaxID=2761120 RepID=A0A7X0SKY3_9BACL|nr:3-isopropylmalate dehydratase [Cohnella zeiphila]MBB6731897.1 3-isopropylmalate dehydratase [Cohnella zeiphila]